jgi:hypothetical protein
MSKSICISCKVYHNKGWGIPCDKGMMTPQEDCDFYDKREKKVSEDKEYVRTVEEQIKDDAKNKRDDNKFAYMKVRKLIAKYPSGKILERNLVQEGVILSNFEYDEVIDQLAIAGVIETVDGGIKIL